MLTFFLSIANPDISDISSEECTLLAFAKENVYFLMRKNLVLPFSFAMNLLTLYLCPNKLVCSLNSSCGPAGSYSTILNWIADHSQEGVTVLSSNDVITFFDNNQVLARNWRVHFEAKATLSAVTTVVHFFPFSSTRLQEIPHLSPRPVAV